jgi:hypothetical protein
LRCAACLVRMWHASGVCMCTVCHCLRASARVAGGDTNNIVVHRSRLIRLLVQVFGLRGSVYRTVRSGRYLGRLSLAASHNTIGCPQPASPLTVSRSANQSVDCCPRTIFTTSVTTSQSVGPGTPREYYSTTAVITTATARQRALQTHDARAGDSIAPHDDSRRDARPGSGCLGVCGSSVQSGRRVKRAVFKHQREGMVPL